MVTRRRYMVGSIVPTIGLLSGCSTLESIVDEATPGLEVVATDARWTTFGNVEVAARVENSASDSKSGTLAAEVNIQGNTYTSRKAITVPGETVQDFTVTVDIPISDSISGGSISYDASIE